ncbi:WD repeat-containing protein 18 [Trapelia coarctata]|nr:WD repeat-containing protein 18 [Trapelia coarctata]
MLTESFIASILSSDKVSKNPVNKDAGIYFHECQPLPSLKSSLKKSSTKPNCLAVNASHIFAAQADKAVVHVYNRDRGNQEATIPFPEKISSLAMVGRYDGAGILALGTEGGRLCTGRLVSTPQSHLQATTCIAVDPTSNFLLTGSPDSNVHVWTIPTLLSFSQPSGHDPNQPSPYSPLRTLSNHRAAVSALITGHSGSSVNIAVSASQDNTCLIWDYHTGTLLHTFLFPSTPLCLALDPADRAFYAGYEDGSIQLVDFYKRPSLLHPIYDPSLRTTPTQPPPTDRWPLPAEGTSAALCVETSYDGTTLISGHENGKVHTWDIAKGRYSTQLADLTSSITNLHMLPPTGFPNQPKPALKVHNVIKPRYESALNSSNTASLSSGIPENYSFSAQFVSSITLSSSKVDPMLSFDQALTHSFFPRDLIDEGLRELASYSFAAKSCPGSSLTTDDPGTHDAEIATLKKELARAKEAQEDYSHRMGAMRDELIRRDDVDRRKRRLKRLRRMKMEKLDTERRKREMGEVVEKDDRVMEVDEEDVEGIKELSSSTEEFTDSD